MLSFHIPAINLMITASVPRVASRSRAQLERVSINSKSSFQKGWHSVPIGVMSASAIKMKLQFTTTDCTYATVSVCLLVSVCLSLSTHTHIDTHTLIRGTHACAHTHARARALKYQYFYHNFISCSSCLSSRFW